MKRFLQAIVCIVCLLPVAVYAQTVVRGTVTGTDGPLQGASVQEKDAPASGVITDASGAFTLTLKGAAKTLLITAVGYQDKEVNVVGLDNIVIEMLQNTKGLDEVIVVGYGPTKKITNTGAVTAVSANDVRKLPTPNIQNTLIGRAPGFISQQRTGQPGKSGAEFFIRGVNSLSGESQKPLIIVDDVEYTYDQVSQLDVNEIESISILKDASTTAVYGIKGANGVLVITTRRGKTGKPVINFNTEHGLQTPTTVPKFLDAFTVASLRNEAMRNDGITPLDFTDADLEHWRLKNDPYGHADVDWYNTIFKKYAYQTRNNIDISGGSERVKYFISGGYTFQDGLLRNFRKSTDDAPKNNYSYQRYNFRSNLDMQATKSLKLRLDVSGRIGTLTEPHIATSPLATIYSFQRLPPYAQPIINPDGSYPWAFRSRNIYYETSLIGRLALQGYDKTFRNELNILFNADQRLDFIMKGLSISGRIAYAGDISYDRGLYRNNIPAFYYNPTDGSYTIHNNGLYRLEPLTLSTTGQNTISRKTVNSLGRLNYTKVFAKHTLRAMVLYNLNNATLGNYNSDVSAVQEYAPVTTQGVTFRTEYNYAQRYLLEVNGAYNGTSQFVGRKTKGFFPAVSAGWNISEEKFFKGRMKFIDMLKLRGSWGITGSDITAGNVYKTEQFYKVGPAYNFGETSNGFSSIEEGPFGNINITWEKSRKTNVGIDAQLFDNKLSFTIDYFYDYRYDQLYTKNDVLKIIGIDLPVTNSAITQNKGFDGQIGYHNRKEKFSYGTIFTFSHAKNKVIYQGEAAPRYEYLAKTGRPIGQGFGYHVLGLFQTQAEVDSYPHLANAQPGDLKYQDVNEDGVIDQQDYRPIGKPNLPQTVLGSSISLGYGSLSLNVLFQGSFNYSYRIATAQVIPFQANLQEITLGRWTPETAATATFPRLSSNLAGPSSPSNVSDFWMVNNAKYVRLKSVELGFQLPKNWVSRLHISTARLYVSGYDLFTWANFKLYTQDPEIQSGGSGAIYPVQKIYNAGLQIGF